MATSRGELEITCRQALQRIGKELRDLEPAGLGFALLVRPVTRRGGGLRPIGRVLPVQQMTMPTQSRCKSCNAPIFWASTAKGEAMPVDVEPRQDGNVLLYRRSNGLLRAEVLGKDVPRSPDRRYRVSHLATCPHAAEHRKEG